MMNGMANGSFINCGPVIGYRSAVTTKAVKILLLSGVVLSGPVLVGCGDKGAAPIVPTISTASGPSRTSTIALTSDNQKLVVINRQNASVSVVQVRDSAGQDTENKLTEIIVGKDPRFVAITPDDQKAFVTNAGDSSVSVIDLSRMQLLLNGNAIKVGTEPRGIAVTPNGKYAFVANHTQGTVSVISVENLVVVNTVAVGGNPMAIAITNDGDTDDRDESVVVTRFFSEVIDPINRPDGFNDSKHAKVDYFTVASSLSSNPVVNQYTLAPIANSGFTADRRQFCRNTRDVLQNNGDPSNGNKTVFFNAGADGTGDGASKLDNPVFCPDINSTDASPTGVIAKSPEGVYPNQLFSALIRNGVLYLPNIGASPEPPVKFNVNIQALVSAVNLSNGTEVFTNLNDQIKVEKQPGTPANTTPANESLDRLFGNDLVAIDANLAGDTFLVVSRGGNYVMRATLASDGKLDIAATTGVVRYKTGNIPSGVVISSDGKRAYTNNEVSTSITAINLETNSVMKRDISSSEPPTPGTQKHRNVLGKLAFYTALGLPDKLDTNNDGSFDYAIRDIEPLAFRGKASDNAWSSCASCHEDGHTDNVTWIFPTGPRQTIALEGTFANDNPADQRILNWSGVRGSITDFNNNARAVQGGVGFANEAGNSGKVFNHGPTKGISDALDAMTEWVANAVRTPNMPVMASTFDLSVGRQVFIENCSACHGGKKWTKSSIVAYATNPTFAFDPLGANFFTPDLNRPLDPNLEVKGPQIFKLSTPTGAITFLDNVGTRDAANPLEIRGAGNIAGQSTQGFDSLGGAGFNTPSLLGVAYHSPYLHDGSAVTLDDVFARHTLPAAAGATIKATIGDPVKLKALQDFVRSIDDSTEPVL